MRRTAIGVALATMLGCGGGGGKPPAAVADVPAGGVGAKAPRGEARGASKALRDAFFTSSPDDVVYLDVQSLARAPLSAEIGAQVDKISGGTIDAPVRACLTTFFASAKEIAATKDLLVVRIDPSSEGPVAECVPRFVEAPRGPPSRGSPRPGARERW